MAASAIPAMAARPPAQPSVNAHGVVVDQAGNIYIADGIFNFIRKVNTKRHHFHIRRRQHNQPGRWRPRHQRQARFHAGRSMRVSLSIRPGIYYIADAGDMRVRKVDAATGIITTVAGNSTSLGLGGFSGDGGPATGAALNSPDGVALDSAGNIYIADYGNQRIRKVDTSGKHLYLRRHRIRHRLRLRRRRIRPTTPN